jgi:hypothetical protein
MGRAGYMVVLKCAVCDGRIYICKSMRVLIQGYSKLLLGFNSLSYTVYLR